MSHYTHLSMKDRQRFCTYLQMGLSMKEISLRLDRHRRELNRNREYGLYLPSVACEKASARAHHGRRSKLQKDGYLRDYVVRSLKKGWSPEQISGRMKYQKLIFGFN